jgi:hypothetical protein
LFLCEIQIELLPFLLLEVIFNKIYSAFNFLEINQKILNMK